MNDDSTGIGLDQKRRKVPCFLKGNLKRVDKIGDFTQRPDEFIYAKENGDNKIEFYRFRGYKNRKLNGRNIKPPEVDEDTELRLERLSESKEEEIMREIDKYIE